MGMVERDTHGRDHPTAIAILNFQTRVLPIKLSQSRACVGQTDALIVRSISGQKPRSVVLNSKFHLAIDLRCGDQNPTG
jgi:hypothetical protein